MESTEKTNLNKAQQQISLLQQTVNAYKERLREVSTKLPKSELDALLINLGIKDILEAPRTELPNGVEPASEALSNGKLGKFQKHINYFIKKLNYSLLDDDKLLIDTNSTTASTHSSSPSSFLPIVPPRNNLSSQISIGGKSNSQKMDELLLNSDSDSDFDPRADEIQDNVSNGRNAISNDLFGFEPAKSFGQQLFFNNNDNKLQNNNTNNSSLLINSNNNSINSSCFSNELNITPPLCRFFFSFLTNWKLVKLILIICLVAPPPKIAAPRRLTPATTGNGLNGNTDLFGSDPFDMNNGPTIFKVLS